MEIGLDDAYSLSSPDDNRKLYAKWAATYESDFVKKQGYEHPKVIAEIFNREIPVVQKVIDVGTGTFSVRSLICLNALLSIFASFSV